MKGECYENCSDRGICQSGECWCANSTGSYCEYDSGFSLFGLLILALIFFVFAAVLI